MPLPKHPLTAAAAILGWFALIGQLYLMILNRQVGLTETLIRFFSYFTILTNLILAICYTVLWLFPESNAGKFFAKATTRTAITAYIGIVFIVYQTVLRQVWTFEGFGWLINELLHTVTPLYAMFLLYRFPGDKIISYSECIRWLIYPAFYFVWILIFGYLTGWYPYFFVDVNKLGYAGMLKNAAIVSIIFLLFSVLFIYLHNLRYARSRKDYRSHA